MTTSVLKIATAMAILSNLAQASVPTKCLTPVTVETQGVKRGNSVSIDDVVAEIADADTHFFGLRACSQKAIVDGDEIAGRLISVQFYLKDDKRPDDLIEMEIVGPIMPEETLICVRKKLEFADYFVDKVTIYETDIGIEAMKFSVGEFSETFGTPIEGAEETEILFTTESRLVSLSGFTSYTGIKSVQLSSLNKDCAKLAEEQAVEQEQLDTALKAAELDTEEKSSSNFLKTVIVSFTLLIVMAVISIIACFCASKDLLKRLNK